MSVITEKVTRSKNYKTPEELKVLKKKQDKLEK